MEIVHPYVSTRLAQIPPCVVFQVLIVNFSILRGHLAVLIYYPDASQLPLVVLIHQSSNPIFKFGI
jgi:hypothetical protein